MDALDIWPSLPLVVSGMKPDISTGMDNIIAALVQSNRVRKATLLHLADWEMEKVLAAMQVPFPELAHLELWFDGETSVIPDSFLGGSAPHLQHFEFHFQDCQTCFYLLLALSPFGSPTFLILGTFLPKQWLPPFPC